MNHGHSQHDVSPKAFRGSRYSIGLFVVGTIAPYFLITEHRAHFFAAPPLLLLLACPLMHIFMHHGHGGHGSGEDRPVDDRRGDGAPPPLKPPGGAP